MLIGSKEIFGIEFEITKIFKKRTLSGKVVLWLNNQYIGYYDGKMVIHSFNGTLLAIRHSDRNISNNQNLLELVESENIEILQQREDGWYFSDMGETFDDFGIAIIHNIDKVVVWWKLERKHLGRHIGYPEEVQLGVVDKNIFNIVVDEYINSLPKGITP